MAKSGQGRNSSSTGVVATGLAFGSLFLLLTLLAGFWLHFAWNAVREEKLNALSGLARVGASSADQFFQQYEASLPMLMKDLADGWRRGDYREVNARLLRYRQSEGNVSAIYLFTPDGEMRASSEGSTGLPSAKHMDDPVFKTDFEKAKAQDGMVIGRTRFGRMINGWIIPVRIRNLDDSGQVRFVLSAVIPVQAKHGLWTGIRALEGGTVGLVRRDGVVQSLQPFPARPEEAFSPRPPDGNSWLSTGALPSVLANPDNLGTAEIDGNIYAYEPLPRFALTAYASLPRTVLTTAWQDRIRVPVVLFMISLLALWLAAIWVMRQQRARERERNEAEGSLLESQANLQRQTQLLEQSQRAARVGGWELDLLKGVLYWTEETFRIHEVASGQFKPTLDLALSFFSEASRAQLTAALDLARQTGEPWDIEVDLTTPSGRHVWIRSTGRGERHAGQVTRLWGAYQDITDRREAEERIRYLAHYDGLTGLANRNLFTTHLTHALGRAARESTGLSVVFIDLDRFKIINDAMGHDVGDKVLKLMAERFSGTIRSSDLLARWGGDEFIIATEDVAHPENAATLARRLLSGVEKAVDLGDAEYVLTASVGIATYPNDGHDVTTLIKNADIAMYRAKEQGKNRFEHFSEKMSAESVHRLAMETQLKRAVLDGDQWLLEYQPKLRLSDQRICGFEALVRWNHPERGVILPAEFVTLAEETGLIGRMGHWVLQNACAQAVQWREAGFEEHGVAVNVSARELYSAGFAAYIKRILADTGLAPDRLELELTETVMMRNVDQVQEVLKDLKDQGVRLAVDDFGTGYSSLTYLKRFPLDTVKIDRSFIRDIPDDADDLAIARAVIAMAHSLRVKVVAEGVETDSQLYYLTQMGCDEVQGILVSPPIDGGGVGGFMERGAPGFKRLSIVR